MAFSLHDITFMQRALKLAEKGMYRTSPNPMVGAVFVRGGKVVAEGWHAMFGGPHAEAVAIAWAKKRKVSLAGSTLYVTLEPCVATATKKTPPCLTSVCAAGVVRVVIAMEDPNPLVAGRGLRLLKKAGIRVEVGCCAQEAEVLNERFCVWMRTGMPFVAMKVAMSLDGKITRPGGDSKWITAEPARRFVKVLRSRYDALLVGKGTVLADDPELAGTYRNPRRIILDSTLSIPLAACVFRDTNVVVVTTARAPLPKRKALEKRGILLKIFKKHITLAPLLRWLGTQGMSSVFVEGGAKVFGSFVDGNLVDRYYWFVAPKVIAGSDATFAIGGSGARRIKDALTLRNSTVRRIGPDLLFEGTR